MAMEMQITDGKNILNPGLKAWKITTSTIRDCDAVISLVSHDDKTNYQENAFSAHPDFVIDHLVLTTHNTSSFRKKYREFEIEKL